MSLIPVNKVLTDNIRINEEAQEITFRSVKGGMKGTEERACLCALKRDATRLSAVKCPLRCESEVFNGERGGHERMRSVRWGVWKSVHTMLHLTHTSHTSADVVSTRSCHGMSRTPDHPSNAFALAQVTLKRGHFVCMRTCSTLQNVRRWNTKEDLHCTLAMHTRYRSLLGQINWLQSRTQFHCCYKFSRCASKAASPTIGDVKAFNKLTKQLKSQPVKVQFWPPTGLWRIIGFPDASHRNNENGSSQRGMTVFLEESRKRSSKYGMSYGSLIDYECQKIKKTVLSTTVAELYSFMKCFGSCQFVRGLWMDISGEVGKPSHED